MKTYTHQRSSKDYGKWQLIQANVLMSVFVIVFYLLYNYFVGEGPGEPIILYFMYIIAAVCIIAFNIQGYLNIKKNNTFVFTIDETNVFCEVSLKIYGQSFSIHLKDIDHIKVESGSEEHRYYIVTKAGQKIEITRGYGNKVSKIVEVFENIGIAIERP